MLTICKSRWQTSWSKPGNKLRRESERSLVRILSQKSIDWSLNVLIAGKLADTLESQYQCPTCLDLFISPVSLNCGHTYCWLCLAQWRR